MLNQTFNLSVNILWESLFGHTTFCQRYWESRKFGNLKIGEWKSIDMCPIRRLEYTVDLGGAIGRPKNVEDQVCVFFFFFYYSLFYSEIYFLIYLKI